MGVVYTSLYCLWVRCVKEDKTTEVLLRGTLEMIILKTLVTEAKHGYQIAHEIANRSGGVLIVEEGSLYPALHRLEKKGLVSSDWGRSENNRKAKFYILTKEGITQLDKKTRSWQRVSDAVSAAIDGTTIPSTS